MPKLAAARAQVAVDDINGDGALELVAVDLRGNCAAFSADGTELWERHLRSQLTQVGACMLWPGRLVHNRMIVARLGPYRFR